MAAVSIEQLADVAAKQLQQAQEIRNMATQAHQLTQLLIKKLNSSHQSLVQIRPLFAEHIHDVNTLVSDIISRQVLGREVERILLEEKRSLRDYRASLEVLRSKKLHPALRHIAPSDADPSVADSLAAWANLAQLQNLENEAEQELEELENLVSWIKTTADTIKTKHVQVQQMGAEVLDVISSDSRISNEAELLQEQAAHCATLEDLLLDIKTHYERVSGFPVSPRASFSAPTSGAAALLILSQASDANNLKLQQMQVRCNKVVSIKNDAQETANKHGQLFVKCSSITQALSTFGKECQAIVNEFEFLKGEFEVYKANLPTNVFSVLTATSTAWKRFSFAYDEMVLELVRRRMQLFKTQEIVDAYQRELDLLYQQELREQRRFDELYMKDFPQSWLMSVPGLQEAPIKYTIHPERFTTALPDFGSLSPIASILRPSSSSSSTSHSATSSTATPPPGGSSPNLLSSSVAAAPAVVTPSEIIGSMYRSAQDWAPESTNLMSTLRPPAQSGLDQSQIHPQ
eukprot:TRINITY_DN3273_c0_g1_i1.p1 TRINITY_DN3273_c0_g1~~TRINITY_DN3273_c0_g1_i1.p1  ORF type:complete len:517 (+),score=88.97 TRINITY_DN3273_c0_g1_i1:190-1740(+)